MMMLMLMLMVNINDDCDSLKQIKTQVKQSKFSNFSMELERSVLPSQHLVYRFGMCSGSEAGSQ